MSPDKKDDPFLHSKGFSNVTTAQTNARSHVPSFKPTKPTRSIGSYVTSAARARRADFVVVGDVTKSVNFNVDSLRRKVVMPDLLKSHDAIYFSPTL